MIAHDYCTGCGACALSCPKKCIEMRNNKIGELAPYIDNDRCVNCNICRNVCPQNSKPLMRYPQECLASWSREKTDWIYSASGGIAAALYRWAINNKVMAYGCDYDENGDLSHFRLEGLNDISKAQSSKYSQSTAFRVFQEIKDALSTNKKVLFVGTPCQIAGLKNYLQVDHPGLITVDLICHGTPPNIYLKQHIKKLGFKEKIEKIRFRGEYDQKLSIWIDSKIQYCKSNKEDVYFKAFYANMISRNSCYFCQYAQEERCSDITIGDFWGMGKLNTIERYSERPSIILINTKRGREFFYQANKELFYEYRDIKEGIQGNGRLNRPPYLSFSAKVFQILYPRLGFTYAVKFTDF